MPAKYEAIRDALIEQGKPEQTAKRIAAATFNKQRKPGEAPVTRMYEKTKRDYAKMNTLKKI